MYLNTRYRRVFCYTAYMNNQFTSKYYSDFDFLLKKGWTESEISTYIPLLESLSDEELLSLHQLCHIQMFSSKDTVDKEQAIHVLINPDDTPKQLLIDSINQLRK